MKCNDSAASITLVYPKIDGPLSFLAYVLIYRTDKVWDEEKDILGVCLFRGKVDSFLGVDKIHFCSLPAFC